MTDDDLPEFNVKIDEGKWEAQPDLPNGDYMDVCQAVLGLMCEKCPNYQTCMGGDDDCMNTNHDQMCVCLEQLGDRLAGNYPALDDIEVDTDGESTGACEDVADALIAFICQKGCPHYGPDGQCMPKGEPVTPLMSIVTPNYRQLVECLGHATERLAGTFPETVTYQWVS